MQLTDSLAETAGGDYWFKSPVSGGQGACVVVGLRGDHIAVGDSKDPEGRPLRVSPAAFATFAANVPTREADGC